MGIKNIIGNLTIEGNLAINDELTVNGSKVVTESNLVEQLPDDLYDPKGTASALASFDFSASATDTVTITSNLGNSDDSRFLQLALTDASDPTVTWTDLGELTEFPVDTDMRAFPSAHCRFVYNSTPYLVWRALTGMVYRLYVIKWQGNPEYWMCSGDAHGYTLPWEGPYAFTFTTSLAKHNNSLLAHADIRTAIPTKLSQLLNDSGFITAASAGAVSSVNGRTGDVAGLAEKEDLYGLYDLKFFSNLDDLYDTVIVDPKLAALAKSGLPNGFTLRAIISYNTDIITVKPLVLRFLEVEDNANYETASQFPVCLATGAAIETTQYSTNTILFLVFNATTNSFYVVGDFGLKEDVERLSTAAHNYSDPIDLSGDTHFKTAGTWSYFSAENGIPTTHPFKLIVRGPHMAIIPTSDGADIIWQFWYYATVLDSVGDQYVQTLQINTLQSELEKLDEETLSNFDFMDIPKLGIGTNVKSDWKQFATSNSYTDLSNKPTINGVEVTGAKTSADFDIIDGLYWVDTLSLTDLGDGTYRFTVPVFDLESVVKYPVGCQLLTNKGEVYEVINRSFSATPTPRFSYTVVYKQALNNKLITDTVTVDTWARGDMPVEEIGAGGISWKDSIAFMDANGNNILQAEVSSAVPIVAGNSISITKNDNHIAEISVTTSLASFKPGTNHTAVTELYKILGVETELDTSDYDLSDTKEVGRSSDDFIDDSAIFYTPGATWPANLSTPQELEQLLKTKPCIFTSCQSSDSSWKGCILAYRESIQADYGHGVQLYDLWDKYDYNSHYDTWSYDEDNGTYKITIATNSIVTFNSIGHALADIKATIPTSTSQLTNDSGFLTSAPVTSVNGQTGDITNVVFDNTLKVVIGADASGSSTYDIAIGNGATVSNGDGRGVSVAIGQAAEATSKYCTAVGSTASATAEHATAYGHAANATKDGSTAVGYAANALSSYTTAIGRGSEAANGSRSVAIGYIAKTAASYAVAIGNNAQAHSSNSTAIGNTAIIPSEDGANIFQLGNSEVSVLRAAVSLTTTSDERDKADIEDVYSALDFVKSLRPVTFVRNSREKYISEENKESDEYLKYGMCDYDKEAHASGTLKGSRRRIGLLAQETQQAMVDIYGTDNYANIVNDNFYDLEEKPKEVENKLTLAYANLVPFLIGAIKEQQAQIEELKNKLK